MYKAIAVALATLVLPLAALAQEAPDAMVRRTTDEILAIIKAAQEVTARGKD